MPTKPKKSVTKAPKTKTAGRKPAARSTKTTTAAAAKKKSTGSTAAKAVPKRARINRSAGAKPAAPIRRTATATLPAALPTARPQPSLHAVAGFSHDDIALRAYYIAERRRNLGLPGDSHSDWVEAERQLLSEQTVRK